MKHGLQIFIAIFVLVVILVVINKFVDLKGIQPAPAPAGAVKSYELDKNGKPIGASLPEFENGRVVQNFFPDLPDDFPKDMPIDPKPIRVVKSYKETVTGNTEEGALIHIQLTYSYVTSKNGAEMAEAFKNYLEGNKFTVTNEAQDGPLYLVYGERDNSGLVVNISIFTQSQFERLVTISILVAERIAQKQ